MSVYKGQRMLYIRFGKEERRTCAGERKGQGMTQREQERGPVILTPEDVRREVRFLLDTYARPEGRLILAAGNNMTPDTPMESLEALLDEALRYGEEVCKRFH